MQELKLQSLLEEKAHASFHTLYLVLVSRYINESKTHRGKHPNKMTS